jgi:hypothetical protein
METVREWLETRSDAGSMDGDGRDLEDVVRDAIEPRNIAGLCDPARRRMYPVDLQALLRHADLLGLSRDECEARFPRLRLPG